MHGREQDYSLTAAATTAAMTALIAARDFLRISEIGNFYFEVRLLIACVVIYRFLFCMQLFILTECQNKICYKRTYCFPDSQPPP